MPEDVAQKALKKRVEQLQGTLQDVDDLTDDSVHVGAHRVLHDATCLSLDLNLDGISEIKQMRHDMNNGWKDKLVADLTKAVACKNPEAKTTFKLGKAEISTTSLQIADKVYGFIVRAIVVVFGVYVVLLAAGKVEPPKAFLRHYVAPVAGE